MMKIMDIIFAILHLDIERTTEALLKNVVPSIIHNRQGYLLFCKNIYHSIFDFQVFYISVMT